MALTMPRRRFVEALAVAGPWALGSSARAAQSGRPGSAGALLDVTGFIRLDQNENPYPPGQGVTKAVMEALAQGHRH